jgi:hypothetical protein
MMQMGGMQWILEVALIGLLAATLFHALRLERALGVLKRDRAALEDLVRAFNTSTRDAEAGVSRLRDAVDGAGRQIARQIEAAGALKADLVFLNERGEQVADRLDGTVRAAQPLLAKAPRRAEADYAMARQPYSRAGDYPEPAAEPAPRELVPAEEPRLRSQAERDLMKALRLAR